MRRLPFSIKFWFGVGQAAEGIKNAAFSIFLLFYYTQVLGLPGYLTGLGIFIALVFDAVTDPLLGSLSDSFRHRWGRRHPFMYASAVPLGASFWLVFSPPASLGQSGLFLWLCVFTVLTRAALTLYHVPHLALGAELTDDYRERNIVVAYRTFFQFIGPIALFFVSGSVFFLATSEYSNGQMNPAAYPPMALLFGIVMMLVVIASALGTHAMIPRLPQPVPTQRFRLLGIFGECAQALQNHSFRTFFLGILFFFVARGTELALYMNMGTYFWRLDGPQVSLIPKATLTTVMLSIPLWAIVSRYTEKRTLFLAGLIWFSVPTFLLPLLKIWGWFPSPENPSYLPLIVGVACFASFGSGGPLIAGGSMLADIADEHELATGKRQEGIFFGALSFSGKAASGLGGFLAGMILSLIAFPLQAEPGSVPERTLHALGYAAGPGVAGLAVIGIVLIARYGLDRARHEQIQRELGARRSTAEGTPTRLDHVAVG